MHPRIRQSDSRGIFFFFFFNYRIGIASIADDLVFLFEGCLKASLTFSKKSISLWFYFVIIIIFNDPTHDIACKHQPPNRTRGPC